LLIPEGDEQGLSAAMSQLAVSPDLRARLGEAAVAVTDTYAPRRVLPKWESEIRAAIARRVSGVPTATGQPGISSHLPKSSGKPSHCH
jgi:hypothetical protein